MEFIKKLSESEFKRYGDSQWERRSIALEKSIEDVDPEMLNILKGTATKGLCHIKKSNIKLVNLGNLGA